MATALHDEDVDVRKAAAEVAAKLCGSVDVGLLTEILLDRDARVRLAAHEALQKVDSEWTASNPARDLIPQLAEQSVGASGEMREWAERLLGRIDGSWRRGDKAAAAARRVIGLLGHQDPDVRLRAVRFLNDLGDPAAVEPLAPLLRDPSTPLREQATLALAQLRDPRAIGILLAHPNARTREALALLDQGWAGSSAAKQAIAPLVQGLAALDSATRGAARSLLDRIDPRWKATGGAQEAAGKLAPALVDKKTDGKTRERVAAVVAEIQGPDSSSALLAGRCWDALRRRARSAW